VQVSRRAYHREFWRRSSLNKPDDGQNLDFWGQQKGGVVEERQMNLKTKVSLRDEQDQELFSRIPVRNS
jgi:hypothetical protein